jgi:hypothetical protein
VHLQLSSFHYSINDLAASQNNELAARTWRSNLQRRALRQSLINGETTDALPATQILGHVSEELPMKEGQIALRPRVDMLQEKQADWLAVSLLLPRPALLFIRRAYSDLQIAASEYYVSRRLLDYRMLVTGVRTQYSTS